MRWTVARRYSGLREGMKGLPQGKYQREWKNVKNDQQPGDSANGLLWDRKELTAPGLNPITHPRDEAHRQCSKSATILSGEM